MPGFPCSSSKLHITLVNTPNRPIVAYGTVMRRLATYQAQIANDQTSDFSLKIFLVIDSSAAHFIESSTYKTTTNRTAHCRSPPAAHLLR